MKRFFIIITVLFLFISAVPVYASDCGSFHFFTAYEVTKEPTYTEEGEQYRYCTLCGLEERMVIPVLSRPDVEYGIVYSTLTLKNLYDVRDIFIATGVQNSYRDVKNNLIYGLTSAKLGGSTEYSYTFSTSGMHTVYIRFNDTRTHKLIININAQKPVFKPGNGKLTVSNLEDAKVLRVAKGVYDSVAQMKASGSIVNYTGRILSTGSYTLSFTKNYEYYTIAVEYKTGYVELYKYVVYGVL